MTVMTASGTALEAGAGIHPTAATTTTLHLKLRQTIVLRQALHLPLVAATTPSQTEAKSQKVMEAIDTLLHRRQQHATKSMTIGECSSHDFPFLTVQFSFFFWLLMFVAFSM
jgi:hypothetical protein